MHLVHRYMYVAKHTVTATLKSVVCHVPLSSCVQSQLDKILLLQLTSSYWTMMDDQMNGYLALLIRVGRSHGSSCT